MKVAAYQAPLRAAHSLDALDLIRKQVKRCETEGVTLLCCPEAILGGLADYSESPGQSAISRNAGQLESVLAPIVSDTVTTIVGFTERADGGLLYNSAVIFQRGSVIGLYRKLYPAIRRSVYAAGSDIPVFQVEGLTFGIVICNDSNYFEPARLMAAQGASALFICTNNGLPSTIPGARLAAEARNIDIARAVENSMWVVRADVAGRADVVGRTGELVSWGSSEIVNPNGMVVQSARPLSEDLIVAEIATAPPACRRGWDAARNPAVMDSYRAKVAESATLNQGK